MEVGIFELILYAIVAFCGLIVVGISYLIYRAFRNGTGPKWLRFLALIPVLVFIFLIYRLYVPGDAHFEGHFTSITRIQFPDDGEVIYTATSEFDDFGDGTQLSIFTVGEEVRTQVIPNLQQDGYNELQLPNNYAFEKEYGDVTREWELLTQGENINVGFLADGKSLFIQIVNW